MTDEPVIRHREAAYGGESRVLENRHLRLALHRRLGGWGWGELFGSAAAGRPYLGILEHFGEIDFPAYAHPLRLEAETVREEAADGAVTLAFPLRLQIPEEPCMAWDNISPVEGELVLALGPEDAGVRYRLRVRARFRVNYRYLRGPWLRLGAYDDGMRRDDAIFPGLEWLVGDEWSSGTESFGPGNHRRVTPHPHKIASPLLVLARDGQAVRLSWPAQAHLVGAWDAHHELQPVFASPNFLDHRPEHVLGLMMPAVSSGHLGLAENALAADPPPLLPRRDPVVIEAEIAVVPGRSLDAIVHWVRTRGLPPPAAPRWPESEAVDRIARALDTHLWEEGKGWLYGSPRPRVWMIAKPWGRRWRRLPHMYLHFIDQYVAQGADRALAERLAAKAGWCRRQGHFQERRPARFLPGTHEMLRWFTDADLRDLAAQVMAGQRADGAVPFRLAMLGDHFAAHGPAANRWKPMGRDGDTPMDLAMTSALLLLLLGEALDDEAPRAAARRALEFTLPVERPAGGDWWECPLQAANLLSALHAAAAYWAGWRVTGDERFRARSRHYLRSLLQFTYLWEPEGKPRLYEAKPLYGTTGWHYMAWTDRCVHWHLALMVDLCRQLGFDWAAFDPEIDWRTYERGVTMAGLRWLVDASDPQWMRRSEDRSEAVLAGRMDMVLADVHDPVGDTYGGLALGLEPCWIASQLLPDPP